MGEALKLRARLAGEHAELQRQLGEYSFSVVHELKAPLAALRANLQLLERQSGGAEQSPRWNIAYRQIDDMAALLDGYMRLARCGALPEACPLSLAQLCAETAALLRAYLTARGVCLSEDYQSGLPLIRGDEQRLKQVLINLLGNAASACSNGGHIALTVGGDQREQWLKVSDDGCGIDLERLGIERLEQVFEPYVSSRGSGLGLAICRRIIDECGGAISVSSSVGRGTEFVVRLPV
ncbi:MAG: HAMP domain-containing sensor histidine kinase [Bacillota bacterium]|nr:HAMP domain-containing sensor histidine kinase [Bacillota bacterium]